MIEKRTGLIHIYCGDGKGKTTAAMGLCCRAAGAGLRVVICQFMKPNTSSERAVLAPLPNVTFLDGLAEEKFSFRLSPAEREERKVFYADLLEKAAQTARVMNADVVLLDEVLYAVGAGLLEERSVLKFLDSREPSLEVILTGRDPGDAIAGRADYISEIRKVRHPYDEGIPARDGIER